MKKILLILSLLLSFNVYAFEDSCVQYQRDDSSWGDAYKVPAKVLSGRDIIEITKDRSKYKTYKNYAVVEWPNGGYSALEFPSHQRNLPSYSYRTAKDQNGRTYRIKKGPSYGNCR